MPSIASRESHILTWRVCEPSLPFASQMCLALFIFKEIKERKDKLKRDSPLIPMSIRVSNEFKVISCKFLQAKASLISLYLRASTLVQIDFIKSIPNWFNIKAYTQKQKMQWSTYIYIHILREKEAGEEEQKQRNS